MTKVNLGHDTSGRPLVVDATWLAKLRWAEAQLGWKFTIVQGSWRGGHGAEASAGTHDRGGVADLRSWNIPAHIGIWQALTALRRAGLIAWYRTKAQGFDIITWTLERSGPLATTGRTDYYYQSITPAIDNDGDTYKLLDVLARQVGIRGIFSDGPATVTYYANCMGL